MGKSRSIPRLGASRRLLSSAALGGALVACVAAPSAQAVQVIDKSIVATCELFTTAGVSTEATVRVTVRIFGEAPDVVPQGQVAYVTKGRSVITLSAGAVNVARSFGDTVEGNASEVIADLTNTSPAQFNLVGVTPIVIPKTALIRDTAATLLVPATGVLPPIGPAKAIGPVGSKIDVRFNRVTASARFTSAATPTAPPSAYILKCNPAPGADTLLGSATVGAPLPLPTVTKVLGTGVAGVGGTAVIYGTNFTSVKSVKFGTKLARKVTVSSAGQLTAVAPPLTAGQYRVTVTTAAGTSLQNLKYTVK